MTRAAQKLAPALAAAAAAGLLAACPTPPFHYPPGPPVIERFSATPFAVDPGGATILAWAVTGAEAVELVGLPGGRARVEPSGSRTLSPAGTTRFELVATNPAGSSTAAVVVEVAGAELVAIETFEARPDVVLAGDPVEVAWRAAFARRVALSSSDGRLSVPEAASEGRAVFRPERDVQVVLRAEGRGGPVEAVKAIRVRPVLPSILELRVVPHAIASDEEAILVWNVAGADSVRLREVDATGTSRPLADPASPRGAMRVAGSGGPRTFVIEADNAAGRAEERARLEILERAPPEIRSFTLTPTVTGPGGQVLAEYAAANVTRTVISGDLGVYWTSSFASAEVLLDAPPASGAFTLEAIDEPAARTATRAAHLAVDPALPRIVELHGHPLPFRPGEPVTVRWSTEGAALTILSTDWGSVLHTATTAAAAFTFAPAAGATLILEAAGERGSTYRWLELEATE